MCVYISWFIFVPNFVEKQQKKLAIAAIALEEMKNDKTTTN